MSAIRTQIYLTPELRARIDRVARAKGTTMADVIRTAVDQYLDEPDPSTALAATFGADPTAQAPARGEWIRG